MRLFKYVPPNRVDVLQTGLICFSRPSVLNDIFEMQPIFEHLGTLEAVKKFEAEHWERMLDETIEGGHARRTPEERRGLTLEQAKALARERAGDVSAQVHEVVESGRATVGARALAWLDSTVGVLSLTEAPDSLLMWAHYARRHEGFLIEFNSEHAFFHQRCGENGEFGELMRVKYGNRPKTVMIEATIGDLFFTKSIDWSYELEWRVVLPLERAAEAAEDGEWPLHLFALDSGCITGVVLGCRMADTDRASVLKTLGTSEALRHVRLQQAVEDKHEYGVHIEDVQP